MFPKIVTLAGFGLLLSPLTVLATGNAFNFDCDTPAGRFSQVEMPVGVGGVVVTGELQLNEARSDPRWVPTAFVMLHNGEPESGVGFRAAVLRESADKITLHAQNLEIDDLSAFGSVPWATKTIPFKLELSKSGQMIVSAGSETIEVEDSLKLASTLSLGCSTGDFSFREIRISSQTPEM